METLLKLQAYLDFKLQELISVGESPKDISNGEYWIDMLVGIGVSNALWMIFS